MGYKRKTTKVRIQGLANIVAAIKEAGKADALAKELNAKDVSIILPTNIFDHIQSVAASIPSIANNESFADLVEPCPPGQICWGHRDFM